VNGDTTVQDHSEPDCNVAPNPLSIFSHHKGLHVAHLNVRSLLKHIDELRLLLRNSNIHILSLNETMLCPEITDSEVELPGYKLIRCDRNRNGGGVLLAIKDDLNFVKCYNSSIEAVSAKVCLGTKSVIFSSVYRPPNSDSTYCNHMIDYMEKVVSSAYDVVFLGDFNYNTLKPSSDQKKVSLIGNVLNMEQIVNKPTRITPNTATCLDLIFTNTASNHIVTDTVPLALSDHHMVYTVLNFCIKSQSFKTVKTRSYTNFNSHNYVSDLVTSDLINSVQSINNVNTAWNVFYNEFMRISKEHAPIRRRRLKTRIKPTPWMNNDIKKLMHRRDAQHKRAIKTKLPSDWDNYKKSRNEVTHNIRNRKKSYFSNEFSKNTGNRKNIWKSLKLVLPSKKNDSPCPDDISPDDFNHYFTSVGMNLTKNFNSDILPNIDIDKPSCTFSLSHISSHSVYLSLVNLPDKGGLDILNFDNTLLKAAAPVLSDVLSYLFNLSLSSGLVPTDWKKALVTPIYKGKGVKHDPSNYRPISITPIISKIFESSIKEQMIQYFEENNFISNQQSAYLSGRSTLTALHTIVDDLIENIDKGYVNAVCALDMAKGFDTINHKILLHKLAFYGFDDLAIAFFNSYLSGRLQKVKGNKSISSELPINIGVPQGSILGPLLFLLYVNDLPSIFSSCKCHMYADDTTLYCKARTIGEAERCLQENLTLLSKWLDKNKLIVNAAKSNIVIIGTKTKISDFVLSVSLNDACLEQTNVIKLLGLYVDNTLSWDMHVNNLLNSLSPKVGLLHRLSTFLPKSHLVQIYTALIQSNFDYALSIWGNSFNSVIMPLQRIQNRCARICTSNYDYNVSSSFLIKELKWMDIKTRCKYFTGITMYKFVNGLLPPSLQNEFEFVKHIHNYPTRSATSNNLSLPQPHTEKYKRNLSFIGPSLWNALPIKLRNSASLELFKRDFKIFLTA
jgi:hypothetical protein